MTEENSVLKEAEETPVDAGLVMSRKVFALRLGDACPGADPAALKTELLASLEANGAVASLLTQGRRFRVGDGEHAARQAAPRACGDRHRPNPSEDAAWILLLHRQRPNCRTRRRS